MMRFRANGMIRKILQRYGWLIRSKGWQIVLGANIMFWVLSFFFVAAGLMRLFPWLYNGTPMYELTNSQRFYIDEYVVGIFCAVFALVASHWFFKLIDRRGGTGPDDN